MGTLTDWDFENFHVDLRLDPTLFISSDSTLVAAGPRSFSTSLVVYPIGVIENFSMNEGRQLQRIYEIGSALSYFVVGRALGSITIAQVYFNGPALVSALYAAFKIVDKKNPSLEILPLVEGNETNEIKVNTMPGKALTKDPYRNRGFYAATLFSDLFRHPFGLLLYHRDSVGNPVGGLYFENAYVSGRQLATTAGAIVIAEGVGIEYTKSIPVEAAAVI
ncbi:MAG: hypothetical protein QXP66_00895 [Candidatus Aenigmatarchaeota archaeon]